MLDDRVHFGGAEVTVAQLHPQEFGITRNNIEGRAYLMGQARRQLPHQHHPISTLHLPLQLLALGNIFEDDHRPYQSVMFTNRRAHIFDQDVCTVFAPEHVLRDMLDYTLPTRGKEHARLVTTRCPVAHRVAHDVLYKLAEQLLNLPSEQTRRGRVDEGSTAFLIDAINAFTSGVQNEFVAPIELRQGSL